MSNNPRANDDCSSVSGTQDAQGMPKTQRNKIVAGSNYGIYASGDAADEIRKLREQATRSRSGTATPSSSQAKPILRVDTSQQQQAQQPTRGDTPLSVPTRLAFKTRPANSQQQQSQQDTSSLRGAHDADQARQKKLRDAQECQRLGLDLIYVGSIELGLHRRRRRRRRRNAISLHGTLEDNLEAQEDEGFFDSEFDALNQSKLCETPERR